MTDEEKNKIRSNLSNTISDVTKLITENEKLEAKIESMKKDVIDLKDSSFDDGMFLAVDELCRKWGISD